MSVSYHYTNLTRREWFPAGAFGGATSWRSLGFGDTLSSRAFHLLLLDWWAGDSIRLAGDSDDNWEQYKAEFADLGADVILLVHRRDGFEKIGEAAQRDDDLFMEICHLIATRQALELEPYMKELFGADFRHRYKKLCEDRRGFKPKDLVLLRYSQ